MAKRRKKTVKSELNKIVRGRFGRRGRIGTLFLVVALFLIGFVSPDLRNKIAEHAESIGIIRSQKDDDAPLSSGKKSPLREGTWPVVHVADGDTLDVQDDEGTKHRIRLIGANTPETVKPNHPIEPYGPEASAFTKKVIAEAGSRVRVAFDGDQLDRYDRNLAMIYLQTTEGEVCLNELLIRQGLAHAQLQYRFSEGMKQRFQTAENEAKAAHRNLWSGNVK